jgi:hypothetical protein
MKIKTEFTTKAQRGKAATKARSISRKGAKTAKVGEYG